MSRAQLPVIAALPYLSFAFFSSIDVSTVKAWVMSGLKQCRWHQWCFGRYSLCTPLKRLPNSRLPPNIVTTSTVNTAKPVLLGFAEGCFAMWRLAKTIKKKKTGINYAEGLERKLNEDCSLKEQ